MSDIILTEVEAAKASRHYAEARAYKFVLDQLKADLEIAEADLSAAKAQVSLFERKIASFTESIKNLQAVSQDSEMSLSRVLSAAVRRLDETADPETYRVTVSEAGDVVSLRKEQ